MHERQMVSVDIASLIAYIPEIVECIHNPSEDLKRCQNCQFKKECMVVSAVGFMISRFIK